MSNIVFGKNEVIFTLLRYLTFLIQIIRGFVLASILGPFFFGVYGYLTLYQQYLSYTNLGINYSVNSELALLGNNHDIEKKKIIDSAFTLAMFISFFLFICSSLVYLFKIELFSFKNSYRYIFVLFALTVLTHFQQIFVNVFRIEKKLKQIILAEIVLSSSLFCVVFFYKGIALINAVFFVWIIFLGLILFYYYRIYNKNISFETNRIRQLLKAGFPLLIYAFSYYLMGLILRTLVGFFYPIVVMGYFSFANNITTAVMLGLDTITWIIFPALITKLSDINISDLELSNYLVSFTNKLVVIVSLVILVSVLGFPLLFLILPKYRTIEFSLLILLVNQIIFNSSFVIISLCIARKMYKQIAIISLLSVFISGTISLLCSYYHFHYIWLVVSNMIGGLIFINILILFVTRKFNLSHSIIIKSFSWFLQIALLLAVIAAVLELYLVVVLILLIVIISKIKILKELLNQLLVLFFGKSNKLC